MVDKHIKIMADNLVAKSCQIHEIYNATFEELFVITTPTSLLIEVYRHLKDTQQLDKTELPLAIMTYIAIGKELGAELEAAFPMYRHVNPKYAFE